MKILGIETSCDDTSAAVLDGRDILSNVVSSQDDVHAEYGGIVPELAARSHLESIQPVIRKAMADASVEFGDLDGIAVTSGPGLVGSLLVGVSAAQGLALRSGKPLYGINHLEGHVLSPLVGDDAVDLETPFLADAQARGHRTINGLGMLLHQGPPAWKRWFGLEPTVTDDLRALMEESIRGD